MYYSNRRACLKPCILGRQNTSSPYIYWCHFFHLLGGGGCSGHFVCFASPSVCQSISIVAVLISTHKVLTVWHFQVRTSEKWIRCFMSHTENPTHLHTVTGSGLVGWERSMMFFQFFCWGGWIGTDPSLLGNSVKDPICNPHGGSSIDAAFHFLLKPSSAMATHAHTPFTE